MNCIVDCPSTRPLRNVVFVARRDAASILQLAALCLSGAIEKKSLTVLLHPGTTPNLRSVNPAGWTMQRTVLIPSLLRGLTSIRLRSWRNVVRAYGHQIPFFPSDRQANPNVGRAYLGWREIIECLLERPLVGNQRFEELCTAVVNTDESEFAEDDLIRTARIIATSNFLTSHGIKGATLALAEGTFEAQIFNALSGDSGC